MDFISMMPPEQPGRRSRATSLGEPHSALDWAVRTGAADEVLRELDLRAGRRRERRRAVGVTVIAALLVGGIVWQARRDDSATISTTQVSVATASKSPIVSTPERRTLADGSIVELDENSEIAVAFSDAERRVTLTRGKAHFQVTKNTARPFIVSANGVAVRAVGTAFAVQLGGRAVDVLVTEGRVAVAKVAEMASQPAGAPAAAPPEPLAFVDAGKRAIVNLAAESGTKDSAEVRPVSAAEQDEQLAWRVPRLDLSGTPLGEVLPLFNQHSRTQLVLGDPVLGRLQLSGILRANNTDALLRLLKTEFGVIAEPGRDHELVLRRAP
jgi:transmembrane sensor